MNNQHFVHVAPIDNEARRNLEQQQREQDEQRRRLEKLRYFKTLSSNISKIAESMKNENKRRNNKWMKQNFKFHCVASLITCQ